MSSFYHELDVERVLQCPVCFELPQNTIFVQCKTGHHLCTKCRQKLTLCPVCQSSLTGCRNLLAENLISLFSVFQNDDNGLPSGANQKRNKRSNLLLLNNNNNLLKALPMCSGVYKCQLESCRSRKGMGAGQMFEHLENAHTHLFEKFQNKLATFINNFEGFCFLKGKHNYHRAFHVTNMGVFFLNLQRLSGGYLNCWISVPASERRSNSFQCEIEYSKEETGKRLTFKNMVASNLLTTSWLLERGRVFILSPTDHDLQNGQFFSILVKIIYKPLPES